MTKTHTVKSAHNAARTARFFTAESAAARVYEVWDDPLAWWHSEAVQRVRRDFCRCHARTAEGSPVPLWIQTLNRLMK